MQANTYLPLCPADFRDTETDWACLFTGKSFQSLRGELVRVAALRKKPRVPGFLGRGSNSGQHIRSRTTLKVPVPLNYRHNGLIYCTCQVFMGFRKILNYSSKCRLTLTLAEISQKEAGNTGSLGCCNWGPKRVSRIPMSRTAR